MNTVKKTIFLSNKEKPHEKSMATLVLEKKNSSIFCTLKVFNLETSKDLLLGIKSQNQIIKQNILLNNNVYNFILNQNIDLNESLGCVLLNIDQQCITPIIWGNDKNTNYKNQIVENLKSSIQKIKNIDISKQQTNKISTNSTEKQEDSTNNFLNPINSKEAYEIHKNPYNINNYINIEQYSQISLDEEILNSNSEIAQATSMEALFESDDQEIEEIVKKELNDESVSEHKFYNMIAEQLDELFDKYTREYNLEKLIDNSKWVKINHEEENKYYVVGIIYKDNDIKYICYGVPGNYYTEPPTELKNYSQWLPVDTMNPYDNGYWVMYQDADTGENVYIN